jgi:nucleoside-diphosphate-sugar epimerase
MKVFVAGATGAVGARLVPLLVAEGHEVTGTSRSAAGAARVDAMGGHGVVADGLDRRATAAAVAAARPDVVVHQMTALQGMDPRRFERSFAQTNRLRTEGLRILLEAAWAAGGARVIAQSYAGWPYAREGGPVKTEDDPLDPDPPKAMRATLAAIRDLEAQVAEAGGVVLRYGALYGPGSGLEAGGEMLEQVRRRRFPVVGAGSAVWSFCHTDDAAGAVLAVLRSPGAAGVFNIVDDEPAPVATWLPDLAEAVGAPAPRHLPAWLARPLVGEALMTLMLHARGASNAKARTELGWVPRWPTWREGFRHGMADDVASGGAGAARAAA